MKLVLVLVVIILVAAFVVLLIGLTRNSRRARMEFVKKENALILARNGLKTIHSYSSDEYAKNIAEIVLDDIYQVEHPRALDK